MTSNPSYAAINLTHEITILALRRENEIEEFGTESGWKNSVRSGAPRRDPVTVFGAELHPQLLGGAHRIEHAGDHLRRAGTRRIIGSFRLEQLGVREHDAQLIVQTVEEETQVAWFFHVPPLQELFG
jgi:hypothetical protein